MEYFLKFNGAVATVSTFGGELISYKDKDNTEYVWTGDNNYWSGHAPVLFPIVGALKNDTVTIENKPYVMPKHGFARKSEFEVVEITEQSAHFVLKENKKTLEMYPFNFELHVKHALNEKGFNTEYTVVNKSDKKMWFCLGGHAGFCCPLKQGEKFENYGLQFDEVEQCVPLYTDEKSILHKENTVSGILQNTRFFPLKYDDYDRDVLVLDKILSKKVSVINELTGKGFNFAFKGFSALGVWTPPKKQAPFICLEPWKGLPAFSDESGKFEDKPDAVMLNKNKTYTTSYSMEII